MTLLLVLGAFLLGKNFDKSESNENNNSNQTTVEENNQSSTNTESTNSKDIVDSKYYKSNDNKYHLILNEYYREATNSKFNDTKRNFILTIDRYYDLIDLYGTYIFNENGTIELIIEHGCTANDGSWNCDSEEIPANVKVIDYNGNHKIVMNQSDNKILLGNVELILK